MYWAGVQNNLGGLPSEEYILEHGVNDDANGTSYSLIPATAGDGTALAILTRWQTPADVPWKCHDVVVLEPAGPPVDAITVTVDVEPGGNYGGSIIIQAYVLNDKKVMLLLVIPDISYLIMVQNGLYIKQIILPICLLKTVIQLLMWPHPLTDRAIRCSRQYHGSKLGVNFTGSARAGDLARVTTGTNLQFYDVATELHYVQPVLPLEIICLIQYRYWLWE
jgi:hypothetical protein